MTPEEKVSWDHLWDHVDECNREIEALDARGKGANSEEQRRQIDDERSQLENSRAMITDKIGQRPKR
jgi:hypothetical protein